MLEFIYRRGRRGIDVRGNMHILEQIPMDLPLGEIRRQLHLKKDEHWDEAKDLIQTVLPDIQAKAVYRVCYIDEKGDEIIGMDGVRFLSRVLAKNLAAVERVFPFVVTIGSHYMAQADTQEDLVVKYYLDVIANVALTTARKYLEKELQAGYGLEGMSFMSPGSLPDWPLEEQRSLFALFGDGQTPIGVSLTSSCLMIPAKSISGIYFPTEVPFFSCQLCDRKDCPGRKAVYDPKIAAEFGES
ncbi:MAG: hypothetical protein DRI24_08165 [Deltaproteobacteria bacterium]|nr:MAG: hypothetical protein DRI24_08165 [Deltaproteobacteria bacterium]